MRSVMLDYSYSQSGLTSFVTSMSNDCDVPEFLKLETIKKTLREKVSALYFAKGALNRYKGLSDKELISHIGFNNHNAFEFIYRSHVHSYRFARKTISSNEDCEEIVQDIFVDLWNRRDRIAHVTAIKPYLMSSVKYKIIRYIQHSKIKQKYCDHFKAFEATYYAPEVNDEVVDYRSMILKEILDLPSRCQQVIRFRLENLSNEEIAEKMQIKKRTVENYVVTARDHLRKKAILWHL
jgi:RNA polymerase sigma factor (sigma-70 family)